MTRKFFVGGNWKCNGTLSSITELCSKWSAATDNGSKYSDAAVEVVIAPPAVYALHAKSLLPSGFSLALQNCWTGGPGAYTGEICSEMLADTGIPWVILGHSERRSLEILKESDATVAEKTSYAIGKGIGVIACIGELLSERDAGLTFDVNKRQLEAIAAKVSDWSKVVVAYEPVWAIGTGKVAPPAEAQLVHAFLRNWVMENVSP